MTPVGTEVDFGPDHFMLDGDLALLQKGHRSPSFRPMFIVDTVAHLIYC